MAYGGGPRWTKPDFATKLSMAHPNLTLFGTLRAGSLATEADRPGKAMGGVTGAFVERYNNG